MRILKCGCGYRENHKYFDFMYHSNSGCGNEYIVTAQCEKAYILLSEPSKEQWTILHDDALDFDGGIEDCEVYSFYDTGSSDIKNLTSIEEAEECLDRLYKVIDLMKGLTSHVEIFGEVPPLLRYVIRDRGKEGKKRVVINEPVYANGNHLFYLPTEML